MAKSTTKKKIKFKLDADGMVDLTDLYFQGLPIYDEMVKFNKIGSLEEQIKKLKECKKTLDVWDPEDERGTLEGLDKETANILENKYIDSLFERKNSALRKIKSRLLIKTNIYGIRQGYDMKYFHTYDFNKREIKKFLSNVKEIGWKIKYFEYLIKESKNFILDLETRNIDKGFGLVGRGKGDVYCEFIRSNASVINDIIYDGSSESLIVRRETMDEVIQEKIDEIKLSSKKWKNEIKYLRKILNEKTISQKGNEIDKEIRKDIEYKNYIEQINSTTKTKWLKTKSEFANFVNEEYIENLNEYSSLQKATHILFNKHEFEDKKWTKEKCYDLVRKK